MLSFHVCIIEHIMNENFERDRGSRLLHSYCFVFDLSILGFVGQILDKLMYSKLEALSQRFVSVAQ